MLTASSFPNSAEHRVLSAWGGDFMALTSDPGPPRRLCPSPFCPPRHLRFIFPHESPSCPVSDARVSTVQGQGLCPRLSHRLYSPSFQRKADITSRTGQPSAPSLFTAQVLTGVVLTAQRTEGLAVPHVGQTEASHSPSQVVYLARTSFSFTRFRFLIRWNWVQRREDAA